jgi:hypothetical protein
MGPEIFTVVKVLPSGTIYKRTDGILVLRQAIGKDTLTVSEIEEQVKVIFEIQKGKCSPFLSVADKLVKLDNKEKMLIISCLPKFANKAALVTDNLLVRFIFNTFLSLYRPSIPGKIFNSESDAIIWLKEK